LAGDTTARGLWLAQGAGESWWRRLDLGRAAYRIAIVALILIGAYFRSRRYWIDPLGLWVDEATWGIRLFRRSLTELEFRPIGYMALTKLIVRVYCDERTLRLLSYLAGLASLPIAADISKHLFRSRLVRVLCVAVVAYNPLLIDMAREFKPYSVELCLHLALVWLFIRWRVDPSRARLGVLLGCSVIAFPFAYNIVFLLPGLFTLLGYTFLRAKAHRALLATALAALAAAAVMATIYVSALRVTTQDNDGSTEHFWGKKYDVFYLPTAHEVHPAAARLRWLARKYCDLAALPASHGNPSPRAGFAVSETPNKVAQLAAYAWLLLHGVGLFGLVAYRRQWLLLLTGPLLMSMATNALSLWPFGAFRSNVFLFAYLILIPMVGLDVLLAARPAIARLAGALGCAFLLVASLSSGFEPHTRKHFFTGQTEMTSLLTRMAAIRAEQPENLLRHATPVLLDSYSCAPFIFGAAYSDSARRQFAPFLKDIDVSCPPAVASAQKALQGSPGQPFFVIASSERTLSAYARMLRARTHVIAHEVIRNTHDLYFVIAR
jgi:hypothetical protein